MPAYRTPDVYIEEIHIRTGTIEGVGTDTAGFVGVTEPPTDRLNS